MGKNTSYYTDRNLKNLETVDRLLNDSLPPFCQDYFLAIESQTSSLTRLNYAYDLKIFFYYIIDRRFKGTDVKDFTLLQLESVTSTDIEYFLSFLTRYNYEGKLHMCSDTAKARKLSSVKALFKYFFNHDMISVDNSAKVRTPKLHEKPIIRLDDGEIYDMIETVETGDGLSGHQKAYYDRNRMRDTAIITLFLGTGIRISELVGLNNNDINFRDNSFIVTRKGGGKSILYFDDDVNAALQNYIDYKKDTNAYGDETSPLFLANNKRITVRAVENLVQKYAKIVSPLKHITPHKLRSTYGTALYKATGDIYIVADALGHKDVNTTKKHYAAISEDTRKSVAGKVKLHQDNGESE